MVAFFHSAWFQSCMSSLVLTGGHISCCFFCILAAYLLIIVEFCKYWKFDVEISVSFPYFVTEKTEMTGLGIGVSSMKSGERALLHVGWELGYGKEGSFSFPNVPPMADLLYEVELVGFDEANEVSWA